MSPTFLTLAALGLVAAAPAIADPREPKPEAPSAPEASAPAKPTRYCVVMEPTTGSRIARRVCHTRDDWMQRGFDPVAAKTR